MISKKRLNTIRRSAKKCSDLSSYKFKIGAVIFRGKRVISMGYNKNKTHPIAAEYFQYGSIHAELDAILNANEEISGCDMFVGRFSIGPLLAKPCPMCVQLMHNNGINRVFWTTSEKPYYSYAFVNDLYQKIDKDLAYKKNKF